MCAVIGVHLRGVTSADLEMVGRLLVESQVRGRHATGVAWRTPSGLARVVRPVAADDFVAHSDFRRMVHSGELCLIGHARYATSGVDHQPLLAKGMAIAHNGVVSQAQSDLWEGAYGLACETDNDSELLLRTVLAGDAPMLRWPNASVAAVELWASGDMRWYRNGKRPLHFVRSARGVVVASTADILRRSGVCMGPLEKCAAGVVYHADGAQSYDVDCVDLQP